MKCPVCNIDMIVVEHKKIELDYCVRCSGVWFDCGELELLFSAAGASEAAASGCVLNLSEAATAEKKRRCPICRQKMKKVIAGKEPEVLIDSCPKNDGLWFDGGELDKVVSQALGKPAAADSAAVLSFLGDALRPAAKHESHDKA